MFAPQAWLALLRVVVGAWFVKAVWTKLSLVSRTHRELALENLALRQQLAVWKACQPRPRLAETDRIFWIVLWRLCTRGASRPVPGTGRTS
jgi:putative transposase